MTSEPQPDRSVLNIFTVVRQVLFLWDVYCMICHQLFLLDTWYFRDHHWSALSKNWIKVWRFRVLHLQADEVQDAGGLHRAGVIWGHIRLEGSQCPERHSQHGLQLRVPSSCLLGFYSRTSRMKILLSVLLFLTAATTTVNSIVFFLHNSCENTKCPNIGYKD